LAILEAFCEWKQYLLGADEPVTVYTDHQNLQYFVTTKVWNPRQIRWAQWLANFNFQIVYCPGSRGGKPDALSRRPEYRPEEGATHREETILKPEHFEVSLCHKKERIQVSLVEGKKRITNRLRIKRLQQYAIVPTKGSRMAAGHDIYALKDGTIPAQRQMLVDTGIAIGLPRGTYGRLAARSGMASKHGIAVGGRVIDADYTGEIKVILRNHGDTSYKFKAGDRIAQLIVEKIQTHEAMEIDNLNDTGRGTQGFGSSDLGPKRLIACEELKVKMCFLNPDPQDNSYFDEEDIHTHSSLRDEITMLSNAMIAAIQMQTMDDSFLDRIRTAGKEDDTWMARKGELHWLKERREALPNQWELEDGLLYYKGRLFVPSKEELLTEIAKGCHDSKVAGHLGQEKTIELVTRNFHWEKLSEWIKDYVRSCDECQHNKSPRHAKYGLLQPLEVPYAAWTSISVDFITQLPESQEQTQIMVVVDRFTKMAHFIGLATNATAKHMADTFLKEVWKLHGLPSEIV